MSRRVRGALKWVVVLVVVAFVVFKTRFAPVPVISHEVGRGLLVAEVMGTGTLEARLATTVSPRIQEQLVEVLVDQGDEVGAGQVLARLDDSELRQQVAVAEAALEAAQATAERVEIDEARAAAVEEQAKQDFQRVADLLRDGVSSLADRDKAMEQLRVAESDLRRAQAATVEAQRQVVKADRSLMYERERLGYTELVSPYAGLIVRRDRDPGDVVVPGSSVMRLVSLEELWLSAWVGESAMAGLATGQVARVVFRSEPGRSFEGVVVRLGRETDRETREFVVDVRVEALPSNWAVGQRGEVYIETARKASVLLLPRQFVGWREGEPGVFVFERGRARWRGLELGLTGVKGVEVLGGLKEGDVVVGTMPGKRGGLVDGQRIKRS